MNQWFAGLESTMHSMDNYKQVQKSMHVSKHHMQTEILKNGQLAVLHHPVAKVSMEGRGVDLLPMSQMQCT